MKLKSKIVGVIVLQTLILMVLLTNCSVLANNTPWYRTWGGAENEYGNAIAVAADGSIYCVGNTASFGLGDDDFFLVKYSSNGTKEWSKVWGNSDSEVLYGVTVDANGSIYCVGKKNLIPAILMVFKFFPNGTQSWNLSRSVPSSMDSWQNILVDAKGDFYCIGLTTEFAAVNGDLVVMKYYANRTFAWQVHRGGSDDECGFDLVMDSEGSIFCIGHSFQSGYKFFLVKIFTNGTYAWSNTWGSGTSFGYGIGLGLDGCIYCAGETAVMSMRDLVVTKVYPNNSLGWTRTWGVSGEHESAKGMAIDSSGNILCVGYSGTPNANFLLIKYNPSGTILWTSTWGGSNSDFAEDVAIDSQGFIYCGGETESFGAGRFDVLLVKFSSSGTGPSTGEGSGIPGFELIFTLISIGIIPLLLKRKRF